jgi:cytochrome b involved in lipid metabolism
MNKLIFSCFIAFWVAVITLVSLDMLSPEMAAENREGTLQTISMAQLQEHSSADSCWKLIQGNVYDITEFIRQHPSRPDVILEWCGKESTQAMEDKGYGRPHSTAAWDLLEQYLIGTIAE